MNYSFLFLSAATLLLATTLVGCADDAPSEETFRGVRIDLVIGDVDVPALTFDVICEDGFELSGQFNVNDDLDPPVWSALMDLPVGDCSITLTAPDDEGIPICSGSSDFTVRLNETAKVNVVLTCFVNSHDEGEPECVTLPDCELVWADEFNGDAVDLTKWEFQLGDGTQFGIPRWGNQELQWYMSRNATVADGVLTIQAREERIGRFNYTSSRLRSLGKGDWTYGRFEMRAKLPVGQGMWPAFWMLSSDPSIYGEWAASGEIDIMESTGDDPDRILATIHYGRTAPENESSSSSTRLPEGGASEFHEYAIEWKAGQIDWYLDGELYATRTSWYSSGGPYPAPFDVDFHLLLNLAVGGNLPGDPDATTVFPQDFVIDYVRVYQ